MLIRIKCINLISPVVMYKMQTVFHTVSALPIFKHILHNADQRNKKHYSKAESVERSKRNNPVAKTNLVKIDFTDKLIKWAIQNNISHISFSNLLKVLSEYGIEDLPKNSTALLKAKEQEVKVSTVPPGTYTHFGLEKNLTNFILHLINKNLLKETTINLSIFIDNLPLSALTQRGLWVILGSVEGFPKNILFVGAYHGYSRPNNSNLFLSEFVSEAKNLCAKGLEINGVIYNVKIKRLICDAPAKAFVLNIKSFKGYSSCTKCNTTGQIKGNQVCLQGKSTPRKDEDFEKSEMYRTAKTNLLEIPQFGVVSNVTLDYMHLVCLGVVRKILSIWLSNEKHWIPGNSASDIIKYLAPLYPGEFKKKPKTFNILTRWSAQEFRQFLLYHGPVVLKNNLKKDYFDHFLLLHVACRLLCMEASRENIHQGNRLLSSFVDNYKKLYKRELISHNLHGLYHLADECTFHGTLDNFSAFPFEKFLLKLRNSMEKSAKRSIPQTVLKVSYDRVFGKSLAKLSITKKGEYSLGKKIKISDTNQFNNFSHYEKLDIKNFEIIPSSEGDKYVLLKNSKIIEVTNILEKKEKSKKTHFIAGREFSSVSNFHSEPFGSLDLAMYTVGKVSDDSGLWPVDMIDKKCMKIPAGNTKAVMIGLLDENF